MKKNIGKQEAKRIVDEFFEKENFTPREVIKMKRLAMKFNIPLGTNRKKFCKKCFAKLDGRIRIDRIYKKVKCNSCGLVNRFKLVKHA